MSHKTKPLTVLMEDEILHTSDHPYCGDPHCPCGLPTVLREIGKVIDEAIETLQAARQLYSRFVEPEGVPDETAMEYARRVDRR